MLDGTLSMIHDLNLDSITFLSLSELKADTAYPEAEECEEPRHQRVEVPEIGASADSDVEDQAANEATTGQSKQPCAREDRTPRWPSPSAQRQEPCEQAQGNVSPQEELRPSIAQLVGVAKCVWPMICRLGGLEEVGQFCQCGLSFGPVVASMRLGPRNVLVKIIGRSQRHLPPDAGCNLASNCSWMLHHGVADSST